MQTGNLFGLGQNMNPDLYQELVKQINSLQKQIDGLIKPEVGRSVDWTPVVTQTVNVVVNVNRATYQLRENWIKIMCNLTVTGAGTAGTVIEVSGWPATINAVTPGTYAPVGVGAVLDSGVNVYEGIAHFNTAVTAMRFYWQPTGNFIGVNPNFGLANTDEIYIDCSWEIA